MPNRPWKIILMDLIMQLQESNGYNAIYVIVDRLIKRAHFISINNWFSSKDIVQLLYNKVYPLHRLLLQIILDRGVQYSAELFQEWYKILGIESTMLTTYHPQCKNLDWNTLELLLVQVDKENSMEFSFDFGILLIYVLCLLLFMKSHASPLGHSIPHVQQFLN